MMDRSQRLKAIESEMAQRILVMDGAMGSMLQSYPLNEEDFRGARFAGHNRSLRGDNDLLCLTRPDIVSEIHDAYLEAGCDIIETNTFNATSVSQADYGLETVIRELNIEAARLARSACDAIEARDGCPRLVAGALGPTSKTLSLSPDVSDPARRDTDFVTLARAYQEQAEGLMQGGVDILLVETVFDTLNAKAALWGVWEAFDALGTALPIWISGTITDRSGRTLSGQTVEAFWHSVRHANPWAIGLNCALGPEEMRPFLAALSRAAPCPVSAYPNAGLPNAMGGYDETPHSMGAHYGEWAQSGLVNILGGCCGTTPAHIQTLRQAIAGAAPRALPKPEPRMRLSGLEPFTAAL